LHRCFSYTDPQTKINFSDFFAKICKKMTQKGWYLVPSWSGTHMDLVEDIWAGPTRNGVPRFQRPSAMRAALLGNHHDLFWAGLQFAKNFAEKTRDLTLFENIASRFT
jgi:hypothetical protein